jgi:hypothetical protein
MNSRWDASCLRLRGGRASKSLGRRELGRKSDVAGEGFFQRGVAGRYNGPRTSLGI